MTGRHAAGAGRPDPDAELENFRADALPGVPDD